MPNPSPPNAVSRSRLATTTGAVLSAAPAVPTYYEIVPTANVPPDATVVLMWIIASASGGGNVLRLANPDTLVEIAPPIVHPNGFPFTSPTPEQGIFVCPPGIGLAIGCDAFIDVSIYYGYVIEYPDSEIT